MNLEQIRAIREWELDWAAALFPPACDILEIGAGAGWQAKGLTTRGFRVEAIDLPEGNYTEARVWPVRNYDGVHIPFEAARFDVVFSSNVLEHVIELDALDSEIHRVLRPGGIVVHVLPTPSWRAWTSLTHYPSFLIRIASLARGPSREPAPAATQPAATQPAATQPAATRPAVTRPAARSLRAKIRGVIVPPRHGEIGNAATELYHFSHLRWRRHFERCGWRVEQRLATGLFYTGHQLMGQTLALERRRQLGRILGSACAVYVLRPAR